MKTAAFRNRPNISIIADSGENAIRIIHKDLFRFFVRDVNGIFERTCYNKDSSGNRSS